MDFYIFVHENTYERVSSMKEHVQCHCCPQAPPNIPESQFRLNRRSFIAGAAAAGSVLGGLSWNSILMGAASQQIPMPGERVPLVVKPILVHDVFQHREQTSWRGWGDIHSVEVAREEAERITAELAGIKKTADFPVEFLEITTVTNMNAIGERPDVAKADLLLVYGAGGDIAALKNIQKDVIIFQRWKSGLVYLQYEIVSPRFLRQHSDRQQVPHIQPEDVVTDSLDELTWRLRSLCGLKNAKNAKIVTIGGAGAWSQPVDLITNRVKEIWGTQFHDISYPELGELLQAAKSDAATMKVAAERAEAYMKLPNTWMKEAPPWGTASNMDFVQGCFVLDKVFRQILAETGCRNITINSCMGTVMQVSKTAACLTLTTLNDDGYLAFCESDFVVIPAGILLGNITGKPVFLCNPCYPHDQILTFAHCTGPRKMDGKNLEPAYIVRHFESDYGAAPKVEYPNGSIFTGISTDFESKSWFGLRAEVVETPFRPICTTQIDVKYNCPSDELAARLHGFHWMLGYGDYRKEIGYALRRVGIAWDSLD